MALVLLQELISAAKQDPGDVIFATTNNIADHNYSLVVQNEVEVEVSTSEGEVALPESALPPVAFTEEIVAEPEAAVVVPCYESAVEEPCTILHKANFVWTISRRVTSNILK